MRYEVILTETAAAALEQIESRARRQILNKIHDLREAPEQRGAQLFGELAGYRDIRAAGQRYRIIYYVENEKVVVEVVYVGIRKAGDSNDVYELAKKLVNAGLIARPTKPRASKTKKPKRD